MDMVEAVDCVEWLHGCVCVLFSKIPRKDNIPDSALCAAAIMYYEAMCAADVHDRMYITASVVLVLSVMSFIVCFSSPGKSKLGKSAGQH